MSLATNFERLQQAVDELRGKALAREGALEDAMMNIDYDVQQVDELKAAVLRVHRETHTTVSPRFCMDMCRLADGW